ncbi:MAG: 2-oxoacid:acceptor oxidoreductase subunit alpha [Planctomycetota bacterium]|jgi:2-oxoglutarate ferredoxin oxidoreductase subunit alpha
MEQNLPLLSNDDISIVLCGQAGQGIQTVEFLLTRIIKSLGYNVYATKEYMSRVRGGTNSIEIRICSRPIRACVNRIDLLVALDAGAVKHVERRMSRRTIILAEKEFMGEDFNTTGYRCVDLPLEATATHVGNKVYSNVVAVGVIAALFGIKLQPICDFVGHFFVDKSEEIVENNIKAVNAGYELGTAIKDSQKIAFSVDADESVKNQLLLNGAEAVGLGAIAGGCNFISAYPMSPSTNVLVFLAKHAEEFGIIAEQAEDEIAAMNMAIGAWYAGARALASTSGGGFALMTEGLSLAAMLETPVVVHIAQRPGPATGLPTRTEQGDLELALYAGHGEFPRIILAPGLVEDAFYLTQKAFNLADKFQVPVFILADQYLMDSYYNLPALDLSEVKVEKYIVETQADYKRYALTEDGISPRGVPGFGDGLVCVDSDEHDEHGHITEDLDLRVKMVDKRLKKLDLITDEVIAPELIGPENYKYLVVGWGSTRNIIEEAVAQLDRDDLAILHFKQVYPLGPETTDLLSKASKLIIIEGNATCQFGKLIKLHTGIEIKNRILNYNGLNFTVEQVAEKLSNLLI